MLFMVEVLQKKNFKLILTLYGVKESLTSRSFLLGYFPYANDNSGEGTFSIQEKALKADDVAEFDETLMRLIQIRNLLLILLRPISKDCRFLI